MDGEFFWSISATLAGVNKSQFTADVKDAFKASIAAENYGFTVTTAMILFTDITRRDLSVKFKIYTGTTSVADLAAGQTKLSNYLANTGSSGFASVLNTKAAAAGANFNSTGVTVHSFAIGTATVASSSSSSGISGLGIFGIVMACVVCLLIVVGVVVYFVCVHNNRKHTPTDRVVISKNLDDSEYLETEKGNTEVLDDKTVQL